MTSPTTIRIPQEILQEVDERCEKLNCTRNDFIKNSIEFMITGSSEFDFGDDEKPDDYKGKIPILHFHWEGNKLVQDETTWKDIPQDDQNKHKVSELKNVKIIE